jgi:hypothetical protein
VPVALPVVGSCDRIVVESLIAVAVIQVFEARALVQVPVTLSNFYQSVFLAMLPLCLDQNTVLSVAEPSSVAMCFGVLLLTCVIAMKVAVKHHSKAAHNTEGMFRLFFLRLLFHH